MSDKGKMATRQRKIQERQARMDLILDSAETLFIKKGYNDTTINDIAEEADFSRTSLYQYFNNKEEIYLCLLDRYTDLLTERVREATARESAVPEKIKAFLEEFRIMIRKKPSFFALYFIERHQVEQRLSPELKAHLNSKRKGLENVFRDFYAEGVKRGEVRDLRVKDASNLFFAQIMGMTLLHQYYGEEFDVTLDDHLDKSLQLYLEFIEKVN